MSKSKQASVFGCWGIQLSSVLLRWPFKNALYPLPEQAVGGTRAVLCTNHEAPCSVSP